MVYYRHKKRVQHEKKIQNAIVDFLAFHGIFAWISWQPYIHGNRGHFFQHYHPSSSGVADIIGIFDGKPLAIEVKHGNGKTTKKQDEFLETFRKKGGIAFVAYGIDDVVKELGLKTEVL